MTLSIRLKRAQDDPADNDGTRVLVDRVWPRGISKDRLKLDRWLKEVAPSKELRQWFGHDPEKWAEMQRRYRAELEGGEQRQAFEELKELARQGRVTLVFAARERAHNQAVILKQLLEEERA
ncbi:DUF488 domain-containing protein [Fodinicurvata fenggangensis]|uniref:DUF488 domain-containing protein n=1 Tax=Fodinicurvata fenggangensis TaxID=1121830 RepID=UPI000478953E|nr:DUF488 domain-containing protein [Fodinicurvata fenggangensis]